MIGETLMQRTATFLVIVLAAAVLLTALMPGQAQDATPFAPEATVMPDGAIFIAPGRCIVSPDESLIAANSYGLFDLPSGEKRFDIMGEGKGLYSPGGRYLAVHKIGLYDLETGELVIESPSEYPTFSPDSRFYIDYNTVYDLSTGDAVIELDREGDGISSYSWDLFINNDQWYIYEKTFRSADEPTRQMFLDATTWQPVIDTGIYPLGAGIVFNPDFTRYAVGGFGLFSYPDGEKLFDLPQGWSRFADDSKLILIRSPWTGSPLSDMTFNFVDGETGANINQFNISEGVYTNILNNRLIISPDLSQIIMPDVSQTGTGDPIIYALTGWRLIDVRTNTLIKRWVSDSLVSAYQELGLTFPSSHRIIDGRYVIKGQGVFDEATDQLIFPLIGSDLYLTEGGTYAVTQRPCTVWALP